MKFVAVISKLLGMPKMLKNQHRIEMDFATEEEGFTIMKHSFNQSETVMFLKEFYRELEIVRKWDSKEYNVEKETQIPLLKAMFLQEDKNYMLKENGLELVNEIHLINLRLINEKKTIAIDNIEKNISSLGVAKIKNAILRFKNKN